MQQPSRAGVKLPTAPHRPINQSPHPTLQATPSISHQSSIFNLQSQSPQTKTSTNNPKEPIKPTNQNGALKAQHLPPPLHLLRTQSPPKRLGHKTQRNWPRLLPPLRILQTMSPTSPESRRQLPHKRGPLLSGMRHQ